jgi:hypothetical protein
MRPPAQDLQARELADSATRPLDITRLVEQELASVPFIDMHTHLFMPSLGGLCLWGIDELLTYHYLEAELFRNCRIRPEEYWRLDKPAQADLIWRVLFEENAPVSEAARGVIAVLQAFGLSGASLKQAREFFAAQDFRSHLRTVFELAGIDQAVMTNDPLDDAEAALWRAGLERDEAFRAALRLDRVLNQWPAHWRRLAAQGYRVDAEASGASASEVRRAVADWIRQMNPVYLAVSLPDTFTYPESSIRSRLLADAVLPACREFNLSLSLMIGVRRQVNPALRLAGDAAGQADLRCLENLCISHPDNRFLISVLSRENQHQLCVYARKFAQLMPFGCWWFLDSPSIVEEITRERLEMLGLSFIPQHSDARVLEQVIYKWRNTRRTLAPVLAEAFRLLAADGGTASREQIRSAVLRLFRTNFEQFSRSSAHV